MKRGFTLIELIVVIIIVGILAAIGINQYSKTVEKGRGAEARMNIGYIRKLVYEYWLQNGTLTGITYSDLNVGSSSDKIPGDYSSTCRSTYYFWYMVYGVTTTSLNIKATRCTSGGKTPQGVAANTLVLTSDVSTGVDTWGGTGGY